MGRPSQEHDPLLPCPFCGSARPFLDGAEGSPVTRTNAYVFCRDCGAYGPEKPLRAGAVIAWNTRAAQAWSTSDSGQTWTMRDLSGGK